MTCSPTRKGRELWKRRMLGNGAGPGGQKKSKCLIQGEVGRECGEKHLLFRRSFDPIDAHTPCLTLLCRDHTPSHTHLATYTWPVLGTQLSRVHQTVEVLLRRTAVLAVPLSAPAWCLPATAESRAEMAGVDRVPPEGILSLPNAAAPQLLAVLLNQRRRHKVKKRKSRGRQNNSSCVYVCTKSGGKKRGLFDERQHCLPS